MSELAIIDGEPADSKSELAERNVSPPRGSVSLSKRSPARFAGIGALAAVAGLLLAASLGLPLWQMRMEAPQYRGEEALRVRVYPGSMEGDLREIAILNQYIGVRVPEVLPQSRWLPGAIVSAAGLGVLAAWLPIRRRSAVLMVAPVVLSLVMTAAALQAQAQMHAIGHQREAKTALVGFKDFTPPLLGSSKIAQFEITSALGGGGYFVIAGVAIQFGLAWLERRGRPREGATRAGRTQPCLVTS
jgi:hypothetical protein